MACLLALVMLVGMSANCLAANTITIEKVEILDGTGRVKETYTSFTDAIGVQQGAEVIKVTGKLETVPAEGEAATAVSGGAATYLAYASAVDSGEEGAPVLGNDTIEYIDQMNTGSDGIVSFTYRNRDSFEGSSMIPAAGAPVAITAKMGGTDVSTVAQFSYNVEADLPILTLTKGVGSFSFTQTQAAADANYTLTSNAYDTVEEEQVMRLPAAITVKVGTTTVAAENYTYASGALTIKKDYLNTLAVGTHTLTVQAEGFNEAFDGTAFSVAILAFDEDQNAAVEEALGSLTIPDSAADGSVTIPTVNSDVAPYGMEISVAEVDNNKVTIDTATNKISLKSGVPFAKVTVTVGVIGSTETKQETVYMIPENVHPAFGNIGLHVEDGEDAFAYDPEADETETNTSFSTYVTTKAADFADDIATALSVALDDTKADALPHFEDALNFDGEEGLTLAEYRIYRLLMAGGVDGIHTFTAVNAARAAYAN